MQQDSLNIGIGGPFNAPEKYNDFPGICSLLVIPDQQLDLVLDEPHIQMIKVWSLILSIINLNNASINDKV